jgi:hypothetical protein
MPCSARLPLERGRAVAVRRYPFTIRLRDRVGGATQPVRIKLDPDSKTTGIALVAGADGNKPANIVRADIVQGKKAGTYLGRVAVRASGWFNVQTPTGVVLGISVRHCTLVHRSDGYSYRGPRLVPTDKSEGIRRGKFR